MSSTSAIVESLAAEIGLSPAQLVDVMEAGRLTVAPSGSLAVTTGDDTIESF